MPITPIDMTLRSETGAALTQAQFDGNLTAIQGAVNAIITLVELALKDDGNLKDGVTLGDGAVSAAAKIADSIITLAKLAALDAADHGAFLRANKTTGVIEAAQLKVDKAADSSAVASTGPQTALALASFTFNDVPAGTVTIFAKLMASRNAGSNGGTITLRQGAMIIDEIATHSLDAGGAINNWIGFNLFGRLEDFAGGSLTLDIEYETSEADSDLVFGVDGEGRFGRHCMIVAGF